MLIQGANRDFLDNTSWISFIGESFSEINQTIQDIFNETMPHLLLVDPLERSKPLNMRDLSIIYSDISLSYKTFLLLFSKSLLLFSKFRDLLPISEEISQLELVALLAIGLLKLKLLDIYYPTTAYEIALNTLQLTFSFYLIQKGTSKLIKKNISKHSRFIDLIPAILNELNTKTVTLKCKTKQMEQEIANHLNMELSHVTRSKTVSRSKKLNSLEQILVDSQKNLKKAESELTAIESIAHLPTRQKIVLIVSGILLILTGLGGLRSSTQSILHFEQNLDSFHNLDFSQQEGVLKNNALNTLHKEKTCNAVIIDGVSSKWGQKTKSDDHPHSFDELLYQHCKVRYYRVNSDYLFAHALSDASEHFGSKIDVLSLNGHANHQLMILGPSYLFGFYPIVREVESLNNTLSDSAQVFLNGCNTATQVGEDLPLAQTLSLQLPGREVTGFAAFYTPSFTTLSYNNNLFKINNYYPTKETKDGWDFTNTIPNTVRYVDGQIVA